MGDTRQRLMATQREPKTDGREFVHVLNEAASPVGADIYVMWCGLMVQVDGDDAPFRPDTGFFHESAAHRSDCDSCRDAFGMGWGP